MKPSINAMKKPIHSLIALFAVAITCAQAEEAGRSAEEIAKDLANPNNPLATVTFKNQFRFFDGDLPNADDQWSYSMVFQPSFPFALENGDTLFWRPAIPLLIDQPVFDPLKGDFTQESGLGDIGFDLAYGRTSNTGFLWAAGMVTSLPTASSGQLGSGRWSLGPELILGKITSKYVAGVFPSHQWDVAGWSGRQVNLSSLQLFVTLLPGGGWSVGTSPTITYDWTAEQWTVPLNLTAGKTVILGDTPWKISVEANYYMERSDTFGAEWMVGINLAPVIKNPFAKLFQR